jgi:hypothetical protein
MKSKTILGAGFGLLLFTLGASAGTVPLDTATYNFQLAGGGGGSKATLNGVPVEIFCDDFYNEIWVPWDYTANVTKLSTSASLSTTRFGEVAPTDESGVWTSITDLGTTDDSFFNSGNGSSSLARYEMVAYLVSLYNLAPGNTTSDNEIQQAIWTIMDPVAEGAVPDSDGVNAASYLEAAASWYTAENANQAALNTFLSQFEIVSDSTMTFSKGLGLGGFQEQIVMTPIVTPEPRGTVWLLVSFLAGGFLVVRRKRTAELAVTGL